MNGDIVDNLQGKQVLVTGAAGSIGSTLARHVLDYDPRSIRLFDNDELGMFDLQSAFEDDEKRLRYLLGSVRDRDRVRMAMEDIDVVFHAAALKHVSLNEYNPFEAVRTNVLGTQNVIRAAMEESVDSLVGISTDKAAHPTSVMGATKLLAERLVVAASTYQGARDIQFGCVRFGNVAASKGSVIPVFLEQIESGGPITVTDPDMTRFIMQKDRAVNLVLRALDRMVGGEIFIIDMPAFRIGDLAEVMRDRYAEEFGHDPADIDIEIIGPRPGERKHEKLISAEESKFTRKQDEMYVLFPQIDLPDYEHTIGDETNGLVDTTRASTGGEFTSESTRRLTKDELHELLSGIDS